MATTPTFTPDSCRSAGGRLGAARRFRPDEDHTPELTEYMVQSAGHALAKVQDKFPGISLSREDRERVLDALL